MSQGLQRGFYKGIGYGAIFGFALFILYVMTEGEWYFVPYFISVVPIIIIYGSLYLITPRSNSPIISGAPDINVMTKYYLAIAWPFGAAVVSNFCTGILISGLLSGVIGLFYGKIFLFAFIATFFGSLLGIRRMHPDMYLSADASKGDFFAASENGLLMMCRVYYAKKLGA